MMTNSPTPGEARELLHRAEASQLQAKRADAWPIVLLEGMIGASFSLVALAQLSDLKLVLTFGGLMWLIPALLIYMLNAKGWQRGSTVRFLGFLACCMLALTASAHFSTVGIPWVAYAAGAVIWVITPVAALLELSDRKSARA